MFGIPLHPLFTGYKGEKSRLFASSAMAKGAT